MSRRSGTLLGWLVLITALAGCGGTAGKPEAGTNKTDTKDAAPAAPGKPAGLFPVAVEAAKTAVFQDSVSGTGAVAAFETVRISARVAGVLDRLLVSEGDTIAAGFPVAEIQPERFQLAVDAAAAQVARTAITVEDARQATVRRQALLKDGLVKPEEADQAVNREALAKADHDAAQVTLAKAKLDLQDARVLAPRAGTIQARLIDPGSAVQPGTALATLVVRDPLLLRFTVGVAEAAHLKPGQALNARIRGILAPVPGTIVLVADQVESGSRLVPITARLQPAEGIRPAIGAFAEVTVPLGERTSIAVPELAVRTGERGQVVYLAVNGKAVERKIITGVQGLDRRIEIVAGLTVGEPVIIQGADGLRDGLPILVAPLGGSASTSPRSKE